MSQHPGALLVYMGHGMGASGGASAAQHYAATAKTADAKEARLVLLAGFLERVWRPETWWINLVDVFFFFNHCVLRGKPNAIVRYTWI